MTFVPVAEHIQDFSTPQEAEAFIEFLGQCDACMACRPLQPSYGAPPNRVQSFWPPEYVQLDGFQPRLCPDYFLTKVAAA